MGIGTGYLGQPKTLHTDSGWWLGKEWRCQRAPQPSPLAIPVPGPLAKGFCDLTIGNMAWIEADDALTSRVMARVPRAGAEEESLGSGLGSTALFFPQFIMSCKHTYTRMLQLLK